MLSTFEFNAVWLMSVSTEFLTYGPYAGLWIVKKNSSLSLTLRIQDENFCCGL